jgi:hypothetical protein
VAGPTGTFRLRNLHRRDQPTNQSAVLVLARKNSYLRDDNELDLNN